MEDGIHHDFDFTVRKGSGRFAELAAETNPNNLGEDGAKLAGQLE
jgi:hypothetical protein